MKTPKAKATVNEGELSVTCSYASPPRGHDHRSGPNFGIWTNPAVKKFRYEIYQNEFANRQITFTLRYERNNIPDHTAETGLRHGAVTSPHYADTFYIADPDGAQGLPFLVRIIGVGAKGHVIKQVHLEPGLPLVAPQKLTPKIATYELAATRSNALPILGEKHRTSPSFTIWRIFPVTKFRYEIYQNGLLNSHIRFDLREEKSRHDKTLNSDVGTGTTTDAYFDKKLYIADPDGANGVPFEVKVFGS